ncbi:hypothetical protein M406DRAFT_269932 [Cryphonectria parasitica EP155]|uniref:Protein kinase domain-containing protein n=1 Tax=Cryphonectria parasitica (strain ATCC 38755 / EP155) TaxID=660469 RepID=A0A9P4XSD2_CRYP1|nr:uncharacterized protein M406DRAFT_269932 [Cryphonectria parasitica EP155]KAF3760063.1 hypothetical protein M406DRAFT_269932 [Cryphonectria parasitica EP155]
MEDEIAKLRQELAEAERRRDEAEQVVQLQLLIPYLEACHSLSLAIQVVTDPSWTTQGDTTNPVGRIYPRQILPWSDFPARQEDIWECLSEPSFTSLRQFPSQHQLDYVQSLIGPISSEHGLRYFERDTVENAVQKLIGAVHDNPLLRDHLGLRGTVSFESHTNLGNSNSNQDLSESLEHMSLGSGYAGHASTNPTSRARSRTPAGRPTARGKGARADHFCIYSMSDGTSIPKTAIEYKAPHKLTQDEIVTGLASEIQPGRDVINKAADDFAAMSRALAAAVVTQLFSYMVGKGIQYGYISTGQVFVFLHIPDDPTIVYYSVSVPNLDVLEDDANRLHRMAVAQVFAFVLQSLRAEAPPQSWHDAAARLDTWAVEYDDVLSRIPETVRKGNKPRNSPYKPQRWRGFQRSPIKTQSSCYTADIKPNLRDDSVDDDDAGPSSPAAERSMRSGKLPAGSGAASSSQQQGRSRGGREQVDAGREKIQERPYCSHQCLFGLAYGRPIDQSCPNAARHGSTHISQATFLQLLRAQLAKDRGSDADAVPLYLSGAVGALFKVRLSAYGYTLVAKGVERRYLRRLRHEEQIYDRLRPVQGKHVPVCLGLIELVLPYYFDCRVFRHFLVLSWAGRPLFSCIGLLEEAQLISAVKSAFASLHQLQVLHGDAEARNLTYDQNIMIVDFERAELYNRQPLGSTTRNSDSRKSKGDASQKGNAFQKRDTAFGKELQLAVRDVSRHCRVG